ncbi:MAG: ATP-binding cassette domain-containing protein [Treponema sp.]|nr:ATP-binding cassette domain-containing protein [Treponema sp.]
MPVVEFRNVTFRYPQNKKNTLENVSLKIEKGEYVSVVGLNGSGKSTLARIAAGFVKPDSGLIQLEDGSLPGIVFQQPKEQIVASVVERDTAFGPQNLNMTKAEIELRTIECLSVVSLADRALSKSFELSLGQIQRLAFSGILALFPNVLILDEVTAMLDPSARADLRSFIKNWNQQGHTVIHITHDAEEALESSRVVALDEGKVVFDGTPALFKTDASYKKIFGSFYLEDIVSLKRESIEELPDSLSVNNLSFTYPDGRRVFSDLSFKLKKGTLVSLSGPSGCGKSTLFECLCGLLKTDCGELKAVSRPVPALQESDAALFERYAADDVAFGPLNKKVSGKKLVLCVKESMKKAGLSFEEYADRQTFYLSGGEKRKLSIAGLIALDSDIMIFDEPTSALDSVSRKTVLRTLRLLANEGKTVLFSTHRLDEEAVADVNLKWEELTAVKNKGAGSDAAGTNGAEGAASSSNAGFTASSSNAASTENLVPVEYEKNASVISSLQKVSAVFSPLSSIPESPVKKLPPPFKMVLFLLLFNVSIFVQPLLLCFVFLGLNLIYALCSRYSILKPAKAIAKIFPLLLIFALIQFFFYDASLSDKILWQWKSIIVTDGKLILTARMFLRAFCAVCSLGTFLFTASEREIMDSIAILLKPLALIKIPVRYFILTVSIVFRFLPLLVEVFSNIIKTQIIRGAFSNAKGLKKLKIIVSLIVPLILQSFRKTLLLADALSARYFK